MVTVGTRAARFLVDSAVGMVDLNPLIAAKPQWQLSTATAMNAAGQITAVAHRGTSRQSSAVILTPIMATTVVSSQNPVKAGQSVTFTVATGNRIQGPPPDGEMVIIKDARKVLAKVPLSGGLATFTTSQLAKGKHVIRAYYEGDVNYDPGKSAVLEQVVEP